MENQDDAGTDQATDITNDEKPSLGDLASQFQIMEEKPYPFIENRDVRGRMKTKKSVLVGSNSKPFGNRRVLRRMRKDRDNLLPISHKEEVLERKGVKAFLYFAYQHVRGMSPKEIKFSLALCGGVLGYLKSTSTPFDFQQFGETTNTPHSLVSFGEASSAFSPDIAHIAFLILSYSFTWMLVLLMRSPGVQITLMLLLMGAPFFYFPELVHKASISGIDVACGGSFQLPLIWFTTLWAFAACLVFGLVAFPMVYLIVGFIYGRN